MKKYQTLMVLVPILILGGCMGIDTVKACSKVSTTLKAKDAKRYADECEWDWYSIDIGNKHYVPREDMNHGEMDWDSGIKYFWLYL